MSFDLPEAPVTLPTPPPGSPFDDSADDDLAPPGYFEALAALVATWSRVEEDPVAIDPEPFL